MIRMFLFFALVLAAAFGVIQLAETPGHVVLNYGGFEYQVTLLKAAGALVLMTVALMLVWTLLRLLFRLPGILSVATQVRRRAKGYAAVSRGMVSVGAGDRRAAAKFASEAERLLGNEPLTLLLKAQSAQLAGDQQGAEATFNRMLEDPETRVLGLRGLFVEARRNGNNAARSFAEEAFRIAPSAPWASEAVLEYRCADKDWGGAVAAVDQNASRRVVDRDVAKRQKAVLLTAEALHLAERAPDEALDVALRALKLDAGLVPAAALAARRLSARGDYGKATRVIEAAWRVNTHPELADAYLSVRGGDSSHDRLKRARQLVKLTPKDREAQLTLVRAAIDAREFAEARGLLEPLVLERPTARACVLMAELEDKEHNAAGLVRKWLSRASIAPRDPAWVADGLVADAWAPVSPVTGKLDAFVWMTPPQSLEASVRASIDAGHFSQPEPETIAAAPAIEAAPSLATAEMEAPKPVSEPVAVVLPPEPETPPAAPGAQPVSPLEHAPDDPGPRRPDETKRGWRLFG
ncbi:MAG TPA: heme biosynthesis HemY N-terminal domain-containing protein [Beijerinckiaceae bacterium]|nr:heme biosynthesis HemY N-terminal domain-containing protein [Beijerinckiaceae bacterium]